MKLFHNRTLRASIATLLFIMSLITQVQLVYACEMMDNGPQTRCCCEDEVLNDCAMAGNGGSAVNAFDNCCTLSIALPSAASLSNVEPGYPPDTLSVNSPQADAIPLTPLTDQFINPGISLAFVHANANWQNGTDIYLLTLRLRV